MTEKTDAPKESADTKAKTAPAPVPVATEAEAAKKGGKTNTNAVWMGTAVGVGSAALVAALMYAKRRK